MSSYRQPNRAPVHRVMEINSLLNPTETSTPQRSHSKLATEQHFPQCSAMPVWTQFQPPTTATFPGPTVLASYGQPTAQVSSPSGKIRHNSQSEMPQEPRATRYRYTSEEIYFIWYWRTDLHKGWDIVMDKFHKQFRYRREKGGLQCKFYRVLHEYGVAKVRDQNRQVQKGDELIGAFGVVQRTTQRFHWMRPEHLHRPPLPQFRNSQSHQFRDSPCGGCSDCLGNQN